MAYNPQIWEDLTKDERMAYKIYEAWRSLSLKNGVGIQYLSALPSAESKVLLDPDRDYGKYPGDKIREHKNFPIFLQIWEMYRDDELFDPHVFVTAIMKGYDKNKYLPPGTLKTKKAKEYYLQYRADMEQLSEFTDDEKIIKQNVVGTHNAIKTRLQTKGKLTQQDLHRFFNEPLEDVQMSLGMILAIHKMLSPHYLSVSKSFETAWSNADVDVQEEMFEANKYDNFRSFVKINTKLYVFIKEVFGSDII